MSKRNRAAGIRFEQAFIRVIKHIFPQAVSARQESRTADANGMDVVNTGDFGFQLKKTSSVPRIHDLMDTIPDDKIPCVVWQRTYRANKTMQSRGEPIVMLPLSDFIALLEDCDYGQEESE